MCYIPLLAFFICLSAPPLFAAYSLCDVLALTLLDNPELNAFSYDQRAAEAHILQASVRPNPVFDVETENFDQKDQIQTTFLLSQSLELGEKRQSRLQFANKERDRISLEYEIKKRQLFLDTTLLFVDVLVNEEKTTLLQEEMQAFRGFDAQIDKRVQAGRASAVEVANFKVLRATAAIELQKAQNEWYNSKVRLAAQWGEACADSIAVKGKLQKIIQIESLDTLRQRLQTHPQIVFFSLEDQVRQARYAVEISKSLPDVNVRGGPRYLNEAQKWVWVVGVSIPLPVFDRNQGNRREAAEQWEKMEMERQGAWVRLQADLSYAYATLQASAEELQLLNESLPYAKIAYEESLQGYHQARYSYLELLEAARSYRSGRLRYVQALGDYHKSLAKLKSLTDSHEPLFYTPCNGSDE